MSMNKRRKIYENDCCGLVAPWEPTHTPLTNNETHNVSIQILNLSEDRAIRLPQPALCAAQIKEPGPRPGSFVRSGGGI